jgi:hypothetical protein
LDYVSTQSEHFVPTRLKRCPQGQGKRSEQRLDYLLHHGVDAYNKAMEDHFAKVVETVNGHPIRLVHTMRFGALYMVDGLNRGHQTLDGARQIARGEA